jgi:hypothetical protein
MKNSPRAPRRLPRRVAGLPFQTFVNHVADAVYRRAFSEKLQRELAAHELRALRVWQETVNTRTRLMNLERALAARKEIRRLLAALPVNLKRLSIATIPFPAPLWSRTLEGARHDPLARTPTGVRAGRRLERAVAYLERHPRVPLERVASRFCVSSLSIRNSPRLREVLMSRGGDDAKVRRWFGSGRSHLVDRALGYLVNQRPRSVAQVARWCGTSLQNLRQSRRFALAWRAYLEREQRRA